MAAAGADQSILILAKAELEFLEARRIHVDLIQQVLCELWLLVMNVKVLLELNSWRWGIWKPDPKAATCSEDTKPCLCSDLTHLSYPTQLSEGQTFSSKPLVSILLHPLNLAT